MRKHTHGFRTGVSLCVRTILVPNVLLLAPGDSGAVSKLAKLGVRVPGILEVDIHTYPNDHAIVLLLAGSVFARPVHSLILVFEGWV